MQGFSIPRENVTIVLIDQSSTVNIYKPSLHDHVMVRVLTKKEGCISTR